MKDAGSRPLLVGQALRTLAHLLAMAGFGRMLAPGEFGFVAMALPVYAGFSLVRELGLSLYLAQSIDPSEEEIQSIFWLSVGLSVITASTMAWAADPVARAYGHPGVAGVARVLAGGLLLGGLTSVPRGMLFRQGDQRRVAVLLAVPHVIGLVVGLIAAANGVGAPAVALPYVVAAGVEGLLGFRFVAFRPRRPQVRHLFARDRERESFMASMGLTNLVNLLERNIDDVLVGRVLGASAAGQYFMAYRIGLLPATQVTTPLSGVRIGALARWRDAPHRLIHESTTSARGLLACLSLPIAWVGASAPDLVPRVFGATWQTAGELVVVLAAASMGTVLGESLSWHFLAGGAHRQLRWASTTTSLVAVLAFALTVQHGLRAMVVAYAGVELLVRGPVYLWAGRAVSVSWSAYRNVIARVLVLGLLPLSLGALMTATTNVVVGLVVALLVQGIALGAQDEARDDIRRGLAMFLGLGGETA